MELLSSDMEHLLDVGFVKYQNTTLTFDIPNPKSWSKTTIHVRDIPISADGEEIILRFEGRSIWGRDLYVTQVINDGSSSITYVIFDIEEG